MSNNDIESASLHFKTSPVNTTDNQKINFHKSSNLNLYRSTYSLNALDLDNVSVSSFDRLSLYSNVSDFQLTSIYFVDPPSLDESAKISNRALSCDITEKLNKTFKDDVKMLNTEMLNKRSHYDKVVHWLKST